VAVPVLAGPDAGPFPAVPAAPDPAPPGHATLRDKTIPMQSPPEFKAAQPAPVLREEEDEIDLMALAGTLWRGKAILALCMALFILAGGYYAFRVATPYYTASSVVLLDSGQQTITDIQSIVSGMSQDSSAMNSQVAVMQSRELLGKVVDQLKLTQDPEFNTTLLPPSWLQQAVGSLRAVLSPAKTPPLSPAEVTQEQKDATITALLDALTIQIQPNTQVLKIVAKTDSARKSVLIADTIAAAYVQDQINTKVAASERAGKWLSERVIELQKQLETSETGLAAFTNSTQLISSDMLTSMETQLKELRDRIGTAQQGLSASEAALRLLQAAATPQDKAAVLNDSLLSQDLAQWQAAPASAAAKAAFDARLATVTGRLQSDIARQKLQLGSLTASRDALAAQVKTQSRDLIRQQQLTREVTANQALYQYFLGRLKETSAQKGIQQADSRVLSRAVMPLVPSSPQKGRILILSALLGLVLGAGLVLLREMRQSTFRQARELEALTGRTVMGQVPLLPAKARGDVLRYLVEKPASAAAEAVRNLRTSVLLANVDQDQKVILMTSSVPGEGKTSVSFALAQNLAMMGKSVLLIEGDLRRRVFNHYLPGVPADQKGLAAVLTGEAGFDAAVIHDAQTGADILLGDRAKANAADLFSSERFAAFLDEMRARYDFVLIDTPPVLVVPDARIVAKVTDAVLFVVRWDATTQAQVRESMRMFDTVGQRVTGLVLNQIDPKGMKRYGYHGQYGAYGQYGANYYTE